MGVYQSGGLDDGYDTHLLEQASLMKTLGPSKHQAAILATYTALQQADPMRREYYGDLKV